MVYEDEELVSSAYRVACGLRAEARGEKSSPYQILENQNKPA